MRPKQQRKHGMESTSSRRFMRGASKLAVSLLQCLLGKQSIELQKIVRINSEATSTARLHTTSLIRDCLCGW